MYELAVNHLKKYLDASQIFEDISFNIYDGEKVGIVGENGCGKSTLLKIIKGIMPLTRDDRGDVFIPKNARLGYLEQIPQYEGNLRVVDILNLAFNELMKIEEQIKKLEMEMNMLEGNELEKKLSVYSRLQERYEAYGGYEKQEKLSRVCTGLKFTDEFLNKDFEVLSGGEKTTVVLGKILLESPEILLLDEPTNHLDMESCEWLEGYLKAYKGMVIIVSHDRYFLDNVVTKIIEIEDMISETYNGNYTSYLKQKEENMLIQFNAYKEQQKKIKAMEKAIKDLRDWAARADNSKFFKRAASMQKSLDRMKKIEKPKTEKENIKLNFKETDRSGNDVVKVRNLYKKYDTKELFADAELFIRYQERVAIIGANGCGKSTFIKILLGQESDYEGEVSLGQSVISAYLPQNIKFEDEDITVIEEFRKDIEILEGKAREYLAKFMFFGSTVFKKIKYLSGGERIRLKLSILLYSDINMLILDEPTNHLDINSINTLEEALDNFKGTILFISHDRYFLNKISTRIVEVEDHQFKSYQGNYDDYKKEKAKLSMQNSIENIENKEKIKVKPQKEGYKGKEEAREKRRLKLKIENIETKVSAMEEEIKHIEEMMAEADSDYQKVCQLSEEKESLEKQIEDLMKKWEEYMSTI